MKTIIPLLLCCFLPLLAEAGMTIMPEASALAVEPGESVEIAVTYVSSEHVNAVEGVVHFDPALFSVERIFDNDSAVTFWVREPKERSWGEISFMGITPGGIAATDGVLWRMRLRALAVGTTSVTISDMRVLAHDGKGTDVAVQTETETLVVKLGDVPSQDIQIADHVPPEVFSPQLGHDEAIAQGDYYVSFHTTDKDSGVAGYYVREYRYGWQRWFTPFTAVTSPYILKDQSKSSYVEIKARDYAGNERLAFAAIGTPMDWRIYLIGLGLLVILLLSVWWWRKKSNTESVT